MFEGLENLKTIWRVQCLRIVLRKKIGLLIKTEVIFEDENRQETHRIAWNEGELFPHSEPPEQPTE